MKVKVRQDLLDEGLAVPVGDEYYSKPEPLEARWKDEFHMEVCLNGKWGNALTTDWDFLD